MAITLQDLTDDPALYLYEFDKDAAIFQPMTRDAFERSIFLDGRIKHGKRQSLRVPLSQLLQAWAGPAPAERRIGWIFHVAQCGSTLLARALDHPGRSLVLREPAALRRLGVIAGADSAHENAVSSESFARMLSVTQSLLGKRWEQAAPVIAKANVPVNFIADEVMAHDPGASAICLYFPLADYVAAILRTEGHVRWTEGVFEELRLAGSPYAAGHVPLTPAGKAAALWFAQMKAFAALIEKYPAVRSLEAGHFFSNPASTVEVAAGLFGVSLDPGEAEEIAASELFASYSKNPALDYDPEVREAREAEAKARLAGEIAEAVEWARAAKARHGLPDALGRQLVGAAAPLLP